MDFEILVSICTAVIAVILILVSIAIQAYERQRAKETLTKDRDKEDWLFSDFQHSIFNSFYKKRNSDDLCGISETEYNRLCRVIHEKPDFENLVALRLETVFIVAICLVMAYFMSSSIPIVALCAVLAVFAVYTMWVAPYEKVKNKAEERLFHIQDDLPRFLSLLEKAMDLPIDQAFMITASRFESPLSEDIMDSINKVSLGADGWSDTLIELAKIYQLEDFSDLILEIVNSYEQGVNVRELINRKAVEVEQTRLLAVEAHDSKIKTLIFLPIIVLKIIPLMTMICLPMIQNFI